MVLCIGVGLLLLGPWLPCPGLWAILGLFSLCPGCGLIVRFCLLTRAVGFLLGCFVGCARMLVLGFVFHV